MGKEILELKDELKRKGISKGKIQRCLEILKKIYIGQNVREPNGILRSDFNKFEDEIKILLNSELIKEDKWYSHQVFNTTVRGSSIGTSLVKREIENKKPISNLLDKIRYEVLKFLVFDYISQSFSFPIKGDYFFDWRTSIFEDSRIRISKKKLFSILEELGLCVVTPMYVSTRGGELRDRMFVISPEVQKSLMTGWAASGGLSEKQKKNFFLYYFLKRVKNILILENIDLGGINSTRENYWNLIEVCGVTESKVKRIIDKMSKQNITSEYYGLLSDKPPFIIKDSIQYTNYLYKEIFKPAIDFLCEGKPTKVRTEIEKTEESKIGKKEIEKTLGTPMKNLVPLFREIGTIELELRQFIKKKLRKKFGDNWIVKLAEIKIPIPSWRYIKNGIKEKYSQEKWIENINNFTPTRTIVDKWRSREEDDKKNAIKPEEELMNYADFLDYKQIIEKYWKIFEPYFKDRKNLLRLEDINNLGRRSVMHIRALDEEKIYVTSYAINVIKNIIEK